MLAQVAAEQLLRQRAFGVVAFEHAVVVLEREFRIHAYQAGGRRQPQRAVHAHAARQRVLHLEGVRRHGVAHQPLQLHLAEGAARLLVAEQLLQADHAAGQRIDLLLRLVDGREALHHADERLVGLLEALVQPLAHAVGDLVEPRVELAGDRLA